MKRPDKRYIHKSDDDRRGRMDGEGLEGLYHIVHILLIEQSAEHAGLEVDHILGLGDAGIEGLLRKQR